MTWTSISEQAAARIFEALRAIVDCAPQLARLTCATERQADALSLLALDRYLDRLGPSALAAHDVAARYAAARALTTLGRRLAAQAATSGTDTQEHAENDAPPADDGIRYTAVTFLYPGSADDARAAIDEAVDVIDCDDDAIEAARVLANALDSATLNDPTRGPST